MWIVFPQWEVFDPVISPGPGRGRTATLSFTTSELVGDVTETMSLWFYLVSLPWNETFISREYKNRHVSTDKPNSYTLAREGEARGIQFKSYLPDL